MHRFAQEGRGAKVDQRLEPARRLNADQTDHRHWRQARDRIDVDRNRAFEVTVDEQDVTFGLKTADIDLGAAADNFRVFAGDAELSERRFERGLPSAARRNHQSAAIFEILQQSGCHDCTTLSTGERIVTAKRGDDWTR